jgi:hypothetical protein
VAGGTAPAEAEPRAVLTEGAESASADAALDRRLVPLAVRAADSRPTTLRAPPWEVLSLGDREAAMARMGATSHPTRRPGPSFDPLVDDDAGCVLRFERRWRLARRDP